MSKYPNTAAIEKRLLRESKATLATLLTDVIWFCTYDQQKETEYEKGWLDSRTSIMELLELGRFVNEEG